MSVEIRLLNRNELDLFQKVDRSEKVTQCYRYEKRSIILYQGGFEIKGFPPGDRERIQNSLYSIFDQGGRILGAFLDDKFAGITAVENRLFGPSKNKINMEELYVTVNARGNGLGKKLVLAAAQAAGELGGEILYISATASKNTVDFYMSLGAELSDNIDPQIFAEKDDDIHLELKI